MDAWPDDQTTLGRLLAMIAGTVAANDVEHLLDDILTQARRLVGADAGSIFLAEDEGLRFVHVQNDSLDGHGKSVYVDKLLPLGGASLAGYCAATGQTLVIDEAANIPATAPYRFNDAYDRQSGYQTRSLLVLPMTTSQGRLVGVLELINAKAPDGRVGPFGPREATLAGFCAASGAIVLERALITRQLILRTMRMAELRDPKETSAHVNRVGGVAALVFERLAESRGLAGDQPRRQTDLIRVAAMLHDVGKVAVSDVILQKPGPLTDDEFNQMKDHALAGARLFDEATCDLDRMARVIALRHHESWDGGGYPGRYVLRPGGLATPGPGLRGEEIPLSARVVALADVYDALISTRVYKPAWPENDVLAFIRQQAGAKFDPAVVAAFFQVYEAVRAVHHKFHESD